MAIIEDAVTGYRWNIDAQGAGKTVVVPRITFAGGVGGSYKLAAISGVIAAGATINGCFFAMRLDPSAPAGLLVFLEKLRLQFTTIVAFTTPVTAGRRLEVYRGSGAATTGGTDIAPTDNSNQVDSNYPASECNSAQGGSTRIAATGTLGVAGITFETQPFGVLPLTHVGAAGGNQERIYEYDSAHGKPEILRPGELIAVRNPVAMDAAGTWQLAVEAEYSELVP